MRCRKTLFSLACCTLVCVAGVTTASSQDNEPTYWQEEGLQSNLKEMLERLDREERGESTGLHEQSERPADEGRQSEQTMQDQRSAGETSGKTSGTHASSCEADRPPACQDAMDEGNAQIDNFSHSAGMTGAVSEQYCMHLVGIEVSSICANQYRAIGREDCAKLFDMDSDSYRKALPQLQTMIDEGSNRQVREMCSWER